MKKVLLLITLAAMPMLFSACGDKKDGTGQTEEVIPAGMTALDLTPYGFPLKVTIPDSTSNMGKLEVTEGESWGGVSIRIGKTFQINVNVGDAESTNLKMQKELLAAADAGECTYTTDTDSILVYVTKFGEDLKRNHFYQVITIGKEKYVVRDINDPENEFREEHIKKMMESAKTLRSNPKPAAPKA